MSRQQEQPFTPFFEFDFESTCRDLFSAREAQLPLSLSQLCHSTEFTSDSLLSSTEDCKLPQAADLVAFCEELNVSSAVEHYVDIVGVTGSIPVPPTILPIRSKRSRPPGKYRRRGLAATWRQTAGTSR
jgi:hypothetical protein